MTRRSGRIAVVASRFNEEITARLLSSCLATLRRRGWRDAQLRVVRVPGGFELPWAVAELARTGRYDAVVALGCVLKGLTPQNAHLARSLVFHLHRASLDARVPVVLGVLTPNTWAQALARTRGALDRGRETALAADEMAALRRELRRG